jgi:16S rRNA (guanine527-N7)-methyltransferase
MDRIKKHFPELTKRQISQFESLPAIYEEWNAKINVISRKDMEFFIERHLLHSLAIAKLIQFKPGTEILDIGTGGGFPGIPLAILFPQSDFHLVDSIGKKIKVVKEVVDFLGLKNVEAEQIRAEQINRSYDFVVSRAVTALPEFLQWTYQKIRTKKQFNMLENGIIYLKGGDFIDELNQIKRKTQVFPIANFFEEEFFQTKFIVHIRG